MMTADEALEWAGDNRAVIRFFEESGTRKVRVTIPTSDNQNSAITEIQTIPEDGDSSVAFVQVIDKIAATFEIPERPRLRLVV